ncbi:MAG: hypothetical protein PHW60_08020 [Kiritimatiellae bacterium]|nr:hypothetical protein [Kiritimatiellia bacterium]
MNRWIMVGVGVVLLWTCGCGTCLALPATNAVAFNEPRKLDAGQWKHRLSLVVRNQTQRPVSNAVAKVEIEIQDGMKPDMGDIRLTDENGFEQPVMVANVREYFGFILLFTVDLPAGGQQKLFLLYDNPKAGRHERLNLAYTKLNCIRNPGFEEENPKNPQLAAGWGSWAGILGEGSGRSTNDPCSGSVSMCLRTSTNSPGGGAFIAAGTLKLNEPLHRGEQLILAASSKSRNLSPVPMAYANAQIPGVIGIKWPQYDYDWMTIYGLYTAAKPPARKAVATPEPLDDPDAVKAKPVMPEDDTVSFGGRLQIGAWLNLTSVLWFDDILLARFASLNVEVGKE